jgi:hypothetical protein
MCDKIFGNEKLWRSLTGDALEAYVESVFKHYREVGFPYYPTDFEYRKSEFRKFMSYGGDILTGYTLRQTMHGLALAWSYFPHAFDVPCNGKMTPLQAFNDDDIFRKVIRKRMQTGTYMEDSGIRKMLKMYTGVQSVSNFRPTAAYAIYEAYGNGGTVWDMSCGWGGRLLGAAKSSIITYLGTEPSSKTYDGLCEMRNDFRNGKNVGLYKIGSEDFLPDAKSLDLCFTSPPYFDLEKYADESTQSYARFGAYGDWLTGYLGKTVENCVFGLKDRGKLILNIADIKGKTLVDDTIRLCTDIGLRHTETLRLALSNPKFGSTDFKYEPVLIFEKS